MKRFLVPAIIVYLLTLVAFASARPRGADQSSVIFIVNPVNGNFLANPANGNLIVK